MTKSPVRFYCDVKRFLSLLEAYRKVWKKPMSVEWVLSRKPLTMWLIAIFLDFMTAFYAQENKCRPGVGCL